MFVFRLSNQAFQDTASHEAAGQKVQTYTEISTTLSKISASAGSAVASTLADVILRQAQSKQRVDDAFNALEGVWEQVFDIFVTEVASVIDRSLEDALVTLKSQGEDLARGLRGESIGAQLKRRSTGDPLGSEEDGRAETVKDRSSRDHKRRRLSEWSSPPSPQQKEPSNSARSLEDILYDMRSTIDQQTHSLQFLTKENSEASPLRVLLIRCLFVSIPVEEHASGPSQHVVVVDQFI